MAPSTEPLLPPLPPPLLGTDKVGGAPGPQGQAEGGVDSFARETVQDRQTAHTHRRE